LEKQPHYAVPGTNALISTGINGANPNFRGSAISYDNGSTWTEIERAVNKTVSRFYDANTGYACGSFVTGPPLRGGIFKSEIVFQIPPSQQHRGITQPGIQQKEMTTDVQVKVYPTPAHDVVNIALPDAFINSVSTISILSTDGKVIETRRSKASNLVQLNVSKLIPGLYLVRIETGAHTN
jgi:hypothetical protein